MNVNCLFCTKPELLIEILWKFCFVNFMHSLNELMHSENQEIMLSKNLSLNCSLFLL